MTNRRFALSAIVLVGFCTACHLPSSETSSSSVWVKDTQSESVQRFDTFLVVDARLASHVASPYIPGAVIPIGQAVSFDKTLSSATGLGCEDWKIRPAEYSTIPVLEDPVLSDLSLDESPGEVSGETHFGEASYNVSCDGKFLTHLQRIDDRVLVATWENSTINLILERPLTEHQVKSLQSKLSSIGYYSGEQTGVLDLDTTDAFRNYFENRADLDEATPIPARPTFTEFVLQELGVLDSGL